MILAILELSFLALTTIVKVRWKFLTFIKLDGDNDESADDV